MTDDDTLAIERIRRFDRFCENRVRMAAGALAIEDFSFADIGVLTELAWVDGHVCGAWLSYRLGLDTGYLCRVLKKLDASGLVVSKDSSTDARKRIWKTYRREADLIHPPVDVESFYSKPADDYYLIVSELTPWETELESVFLGLTDEAGELSTNGARPVETVR